MRAQRKMEIGNNKEIRKEKKEGRDQGGISVICSFLGRPSGRLGLCPLGPVLSPNQSLAGVGGSFKAQAQ
jgi:hypothetical protein